MQAGTVFDEPGVARGERNGLATKARFAGLDLLGLPGK
jgi:hypothetical protein